MKSLDDIKKSLAEDRPAAWDALPDIDLYMDQVLGYMRRQLFSSRPESSVTAAMVNNYIRDGILPRTNDKKYSRNHLARLTTICLLKQVLAVGDVSLLFKMFTPGGNMHKIYDEYREVLDGELTSVMEKVPDEGDNVVLADAVVRFAITSYANKVAAEHIIDLIKEQMNDEKEKSSNVKK